MRGTPKAVLWVSNAWSWARLQCFAESKHSLPKQTVALPAVSSSLHSRRLVQWCCTKPFELLQTTTSSKPDSCLELRLARCYGLSHCQQPYMHLLILRYPQHHSLLWESPSQPASKKGRVLWHFSYHCAALFFLHSHLNGGTSCWPSTLSLCLCKFSVWCWRGGDDF